MATTGLTDNYKLTSMSAGHNFNASGGFAYKILLIKVSPSGTYNQTLANVGTPGTGSPTTTNVGTDETSGSGYTTGGFALTNTNPALFTDTAVATFTTNPSWTSASFSTTSGVIYTTDATAPSPSSANRTVGNFDFGGTQTVSSGTLTLILPTAAAATGLIRIA